jgi:DNA-binding MarR family transcriptional regulator
MSEPARRPRARAASPTLIYAIGRVDQGVRREMRRRLERFALSVPEYTALSILAVAPGLSNAQLARRSYITPQSMSQVIRALERDGLIEREPDPQHRKILRATLTPAGRRVLATCDRAVDALEREMLADVPPAARAALLEQLTGCVRRLGAGLHAP